MTIREKNGEKRELTIKELAVIMNMEETMLKQLLKEELEKEHNIDNLIAKG